MEKQVIATTNAPGAVGPYVQATRFDNLVYCSGQLGIDVALGKLAASVEEQAHCSMKNLGAILKEAGSDYSKILKTTIFLTDMNDFATVNEVYKSYFDGQYPARSCIQVAKLPLGGQVEIECIAAL
ncbi:MAG: RidA family protein [Anaerotruncus sp.]|jgi:2-iminobutanoate/2-iminopropanoate deaminase|nr:RidA family protein [Anaerotruncus sp.]